jgi:hypothetical protein
MRKLRLQNETLCIVPQIVYEFWVAATRPLPQNGLGFDVPAAIAELEQLVALYQFYADNDAIYGQWRHLVEQLHVRGKVAHDARLVAAMMVHAIGGVLTFNSADFSRYSGITVFTPAEVLAS